MQSYRLKRLLYGYEQIRIDLVFPNRSEHLFHDGTSLWDTSKCGSAHFLNCSELLCRHIPHSGGLHCVHGLFHSNRTPPGSTAIAKVLIHLNPTPKPGLHTEAQAP